MDETLDNPKSDAQSIDLTQSDIPYKVLNTISKEAAERYRMIVFEITEEVLRVGMMDPDNVDALNALRFIASKLGLETEVFEITEESFFHAFQQYDQPEVVIKKAVKDYEKTEKEITEEREKKLKKEKEDIQATIGSAPVSKIVDVILDHAVLGRASDIHIEPNEKEVRVRYRVDGALFESFHLPKEIGPAVISRVKIMSNLKIDERRRPQDGRLKIKQADKTIDVRVSVMPVADGEKVVMRILDKEEGLDNFEQLGIRGRAVSVIGKSLEEPYGIILVTGPTGSGKSTTIFTALKKINSIDVNIVTLEDPVEYKILGVNHSQVNPEINFTFASGLRAILRQDPDIIMVGEIRDEETAELAVHAALTGHLVLSTLHTNDALGAIPRLVDMGIEPFLLSSSIRLCMAQRLVRRICTECKEEFEPSERVKDYILNSLALVPDDEKKKRIPDFNPKKITVWRGKGCPRCNNSGTKGRMGIYEVVECGPEMRNIIDDNLNADALHKEFVRQGAISMREDGVLKALTGEVLIEEIEEATSEDR